MLEEHLFSVLGIFSHVAAAVCGGRFLDCGAQLPLFTNVDRPHRFQLRFANYNDFG
jgi:hypothetical protein